MNFSDMIIADGMIKEYVFINKNIEMKFLDYSSNEFSFVFKNVSFFLESGSVGFDLNGVEVVSNSLGKIEVKFYDESDIVLKIISDNVEVIEE